MSFLTPLAFLGALIAIPIIVLYMLRLRRREIVVSSTFLWQQVLQDREANTPWQKLRRNLLLILQLIILALLVFALARPFIVVPAVSAGQIALLLDASASMNATDSADGSRFAEAQRRALEIVDTLGSGDSMTIIRVADVPEVLTPYTADQAALRAAIVNAQPSQASADWSAALTLAAAGALGLSEGSDFNVVIISDGGIGEASALPAIPGDLSYIPVGTSGENVAITALATRALPGEPPQVFAQVTNYGASDADIFFSLRVDGELAFSERYTVSAGDVLPLDSFAGLPARFQTLEARVTLPAGSTYVDYLPTDNAAWTISSATGTRRVLLVSQGNLFLDQLLRLLPSLQVFNGDPARPLPTGQFDIYVFDGYLPDVLPAGDLLIINPPRSTNLFTVTEETTETGNIRVETADPRMTFVDFSTVNIRAFNPVIPIRDDWAQSLIRADGGDLLLAGEIDARQIAIITFDLIDSDLPLQIAFPALITALLDWFTPPSPIDRDALQVGDTLSVQFQGGIDAGRVRLPDGGVVDLTGESASRIFAATASPGLYTLELSDDGTLSQSVPFAVNLFDVNESRIAPQISVQLGGQTISQAAEEELGQQEYWSWLALAALLMLLIEWYAYHRRNTLDRAFPTLFRRAVYGGTVHGAS